MGIGRPQPHPVAAGPKDGRMIKIPPPAATESPLGAERRAAPV